MADEDVIRIYASDVGVEPAVLASFNVQAALQAIDTALATAGLTLANVNTDDIVASSGTTVAGDGNPYTSAPIVGSPPAWLNGSGQIILPGLYLPMCQWRTTADATTATSRAQIAGPDDVAYQLLWPVMALGTVVVAADLLPLHTADLPYAVPWSFTSQVDATAAGTIKAAVKRVLIATA